jgi:hypothetical protein
MNKFKTLALGILLSLASLPVTISAKTTTKVLPPATSKAEDRAEAKVLLGRLYDINAMDKSSLNSAEKAQLGKEVKDINKRLHDIGGGIYISVGAIIIILLLILILF